MQRPGYPPPVNIFLSVSASIFFNRPRRSLARDAINLLDSHTPRPLVTGTEHLPRDEAFVVVANHHHRKAMWIGWIGAMVIEATYAFHPVDVPIRIVVTDAQRFQFMGQSREFPLSGWFLGRIATLWGMIRMPGNPADTVGRAASLKQVLSVLRKGEPVLFFPEGDRGTAYGLVEALPGTGTFLALASRRAKIVPAAFWEDGPQLRGQIAPPITLISDGDAAVRQQIMTAIGRMLPESMWGPYRDAINESGNVACSTN